MPAAMAADPIACSFVEVTSARVCLELFSALKHLFRPPLGWYVNAALS